MRTRLPWIGALVILGSGWGSTQTLGKIAVSTGHGAVRLLFWQTCIVLVVLGALLALRRRRPPVSRAGLHICILIALTGTILPNLAFYQAVTHLPAGIMSILIATIPLLSFPIALLLGTDRFSLLRLAGLLCGLAGVALIALPRASLPDPAMTLWLPVAMIGPLFYALEANIVARWGTAGLDPVEALFGASLIASVLLLPAFLWREAQGAPPLAMGKAEVALLIMSFIHALLYVGYVALAARAGAVF
ncbi:MAG: DMT family transporter, partial [Rhodobacteraceae bacterium]|nr:DMT family transporter [Paracoccaceae bacterium]